MAPVRMKSRRLNRCRLPRSVLAFSVAPRVRSIATGGHRLLTLPAPMGTVKLRAAPQPGANRGGAEADGGQGKTEGIPLPLAGPLLERDQHHPITCDHLCPPGQILADALLHLRRDRARPPLAFLLLPTGAIEL